MMILSAKSMTVAPRHPSFEGETSLWIRTAASPQIGFGHLRRSLILAKALRDCCVPLFLLNPEDTSCKVHLQSQNCYFFDGGIENAWEFLPNPAAILIDTRLSDGLDGLIRAANSRKIPVISIRDLGLNPLPSDIIIDGSIAPAESNPGLTDKGSFAGTDYLVLDPVYRSLFLRNKQIREKVRSVYINLGGGNSGRFYSKVLEGLKLWNREVDVIGIPGFVAWGQESLAQKDWSPLHFHWESSDIELFLFEADVAITAGGISSYEALCAATPLLALSYDPQQQITIERLSDLDACIDLGPGDALHPPELASVLSSIARDVDKRRSLSSRGREVVDGRGSERVAQIIRQSIHRGSQHSDGKCP
jgi:UDP-2,4-diacetamido-2,4,6-trideoxy-beta-L-altropyranose hydrolase